MKDDRSLVEWVILAVSADDPHDTADKLHKRRQVGKDAEYRGDGEVGMVEALSKLADLNDYAVEIVRASSFFITASLAAPSSLLWT